MSQNRCFKPQINYLKYFFLVISLYWTSCVLSNIVHVVTAKSLAHWWYFGVPHSNSKFSNTKQSTPYQIVLNSVYHTLTYLLGSIAFGSLLVAIVRTLRSFVYLLIVLMGHGNGLGGTAVKITKPSVSIPGRTFAPLSSSQPNSNQQTSRINKLKLFILECLFYMLSFLDYAVTYFNHYAFCYVAISDLSFVEASK